MDVGCFYSFTASLTYTYTQVQPFHLSLSLTLSTPSVCPSVHPSIHHSFVRSCMHEGDGFSTRTPLALLIVPKACLHASSANSSVWKTENAVLLKVEHARPFRWDFFFRSACAWSCCTTADIIIIISSSSSLGRTLSKTGRRKIPRAKSRRPLELISQYTPKGPCSNRSFPDHYIRWS